MIPAEAPTGAPEAAAGVRAAPGPPVPLTAFVSVVGFEDELGAELGWARGDGPRWPGVLSTRHPPALVDPVFALQALPGAVQVAGESVRALALAADAIAADVLESSDGPVRVHAYVPDATAYRSLAGRAALVGEAFVAHLRERRRRVSRRLALPGGFADTTLVQLVLVGRASLLVSAARPRALQGGGFDLAPFIAGRAPVPEDRAAPSRAYRKLVEGFAWMGGGPRADETCVDLGGSPGGWAFTALKAGAHVVAVDRAALAVPAAGHPHLTMIIGNAFNYRPPAPVDWLLCDVICTPDKTIDLVDGWLAAGLARNVAASLKFKGPVDHALLAEARTRLSRHGWQFLRFKHLVHHSNEAALLMRAAAVDDPTPAP